VNSHQDQQAVQDQVELQPDQDALVDEEKEPKLSGKCKEEMHANVCSNMYPALLMSLKNIDFGFVLQVSPPWIATGFLFHSWSFLRAVVNRIQYFQYVAQTRVEQNALDLVFGLFNMGEQDAWREHQQQHNDESTSSSLEILRTLNISFAAGDYQPYCESAQEFNALNEAGADADEEGQDHQSLRCKHTESFLQKERIFIAQLIAKATEICPTIFGENSEIIF